MAEKFNNYSKKHNSISKGNTSDIIPYAGNTLSGGSGTRPSGSICQIHSLYVIKEHQTISTNPENESAKISLIISEPNKTDVKLACNILILPNSAFYIEKTITLLPTQKLMLEYTSANSSASSTLYTVCSTVDMF